MIAFFDFKVHKSALLILYFLLNSLAILLDIDYGISMDLSIKPTLSL